MDPYQLYEIEAGHFDLFPTRVVTMARERFVEIVAELLHEGFPDLYDEMMPLVNTIPRFPLGTWIHADRGCGCIVGEYLVAQSEIDRYNLSLLARSPQKIIDMLHERENGDQLVEFGSEVDCALMNELSRVGVELEYPNRHDEFTTYDQTTIADHVDAIYIEGTHV